MTTSLMPNSIISNTFLILFEIVVYLIYNSSMYIYFSKYFLGDLDYKKTFIKNRKNKKMYSTVLFS